MSKIKPHVFHEFFSRYDSSLSRERRWNRNPSHSIRSFFGAKDPYNKNDNVKITEFATEEEALTWYKKNQMNQARFDKVKSETFCKNYFIIPEAEFGKYRGVFNKMIKSVKISSDFEINGEGNGILSCSDSDSVSEGVTEEEKGNKTSETLTLTSPYGSSYYQGFLSADDDGYLDGRNVGGFYEIELTSDKKSSLSAYAKDIYGVFVGVTLDITWHKEVEYKTKLKLINNYDSSKLFGIKDLEDRVSPNNFSYVTDRLGVNSDKETLIMHRARIFEKEWQFNKENFKRIFLSSRKFNLDRTFKNDPIFLPKEIFTYDDSVYIDLNFNHSHSAAASNCEENFETTLTKTYTNLGESKIDIQNTNAYFDRIIQNMNCSLSSIIYIKSTKIYLCFINFFHEISCNYTTMFTDNECPNLDCKQIPGSSVSTRGQHLASTNDAIKSYYVDSLYENLCDKEPEDSQKFEFEIKKLDLKILDKTFQVEYQSLKPREFKTDYRDCGETFTNNINQFLYSLVNVKMNKNYLIEIVPWIKEDFDKTLVFPPKIQ